MIAKQIKGQSFGGLLRYMEQKIKDGVGERIDSNMLGSTASELGKEFRLVSSLKPNLKKVVYHASLSLSKDDKAISNSTFIDIGKKYSEDMGFGQSQYIIYRHSDREHQHIHLIANRVNMNGEVVSDKWDYKRSEKSVRELEKTYGLIRVKGSNEALEKSMTKAEVGLYRRKQVIPVRKQLQIIAKEALQKATNLKEFEQLIIKSGVELQLHKNQKENLYGASFQLDGFVFKASSLGKGYSINQINKKLKENERNQRIGQTSGRTAYQNAGGTSRTNTKHKYREYKSTQRSYETNNNGVSGINLEPKISIPRTPGQAIKSFANQPDSKGTERTYEGETYTNSSGTSKNEKDQTISQLENILLSNPVGNISQSSNNVRNDEDELKIKKKKSKKTTPRF